MYRLLRNSSRLFRRKHRVIALLEEEGKKARALSERSGEDENDDGEEQGQEKNDEPEQGYDLRPQIPALLSRQPLVPRRPLLRRSLSHDSFSTITTADDSRDGSGTRVVVWGDDETFNLDKGLAEPTPRMQKPSSRLPDPLLDDDGDDIMADEELFFSDWKNPFRTEEDSPPLLVWNASFTSSEQSPPLRKRTSSTGSDTYLRAPARFTRFEI